MAQTPPHGAAALAPGTLAYPAAAVAAGTTTVVATPHVEMVDVRELPDRVDAVRVALEEEGIALDVRCGGELKALSLGDLGQQELELIAHGPPGARWVLYETPFSGPGEEFLDGARGRSARGFGVLLAHPERSRGMLDWGLPMIEALVAEGGLVAANVGPLLGRGGPQRRRTAHR